MPVQRVRRVLRKIDPWTVLKVSLVFNAIMALVSVLGQELRAVGAQPPRR